MNNQVFCSNCNTELSADDKFCYKCGKQVQKENDFWASVVSSAKTINEQAKANIKTNKENKKMKNTIRCTMILNNINDSRKKVGSSVVRGGIVGAVGSAINPLVGVAGIAGGAMSGKNKVQSSTTFLIEYEDGHRETKIVKNNSADYNKLVQYLKM
ncbi:MAG: zinc ribbon domain-containing protein [Bacilli bacterium]|nr:zinc ribbon domain-containing protein [Bacilli bacterium]